MSRFDYYTAALILSEASFSTDVEVAKTFHIHPRTIGNYRKRLETDDKLQHEYRLAIYNKSKEWTKKIPKVLESAVLFIEQTLKNMDTSDPNALNSVLSTMQTLTEIDMMNEAIKLKMSRKK